MAFSTLAIEECSKQTVLMTVLCAREEQQRAQAWKSYRSHLAKTEDLNKAIESRIRVTFPKISREDARKIGESGPSPKELEYKKQLAIYSDCLVDDATGTFAAHSPQLAEWRELAWERLCEAQALVHALRDRTPEELAVFQKHFLNRPADKAPQLFLKDLHEELLQKGCVKEGWWDAIFEDMQHIGSASTVASAEPKTD